MQVLEKLLLYKVLFISILSLIIEGTHGGKERILLSVTSDSSNPSLLGVGA